MEDTTKFDVSEKYKDIVINASNNNSDIIISNSTLEHAMFLSYHLIQKAQKVVRLFTGCFSELFYKDPRIKSVINESLKRGVKFKIMLEEKPKDNELLKKDGVEYKVKKSILKNHFLLSDNSCFRLEDEHDNSKIDPYLIKGKASFNHPEICRILAKEFDLVYKG